MSLYSNLANSRPLGEMTITVIFLRIASFYQQICFLFQAGSSMSDRLMEFHDAFSEFGDKKDYVNFLQLQLEDSK